MSQNELSSAISPVPFGSFGRCYLMGKIALLLRLRECAITLSRNSKRHLKITNRSNVLNNLANASDSLQDSLRKSLRVTYILTTISVILAFFGFVTTGIIGFFLLKYSKVASINLSVLMLINLGVGIYNAFILPELFTRQANIKNKLLYLEMRDRT